ncbi:MAG: amidohydrolase family protein [Vicinamibacterales bacterium]
MIGLLAAMLTLVGAACTIPRAPLVSPTTAIVDATVLDVRDGTWRPHRTVLVEGTRIKEVGASADVVVPASARVLLASGGYVIPGLWDMHTHLTSYGPHLRQFLAHGVTGVRDMGSLTFEETQDTVAVAPRQRGLDEILRVRQEIADGRTLGPRIVTAGVTLNGPLPRGVDLPFQWIVDTPAEATRAVEELASRGVDFIKVHQRLSRASYDAIAAQANVRGLAVAGHVPSATGIAHVVRAGQASIEHVHGMAEYVRDTPEDRDGQALMGLLREHGTFHVPTLASFQGFVVASEWYGTPEREPRMAHLPPPVFRLWKLFYPPEAVVQAPVREIVAEKTRFTRMLHAGGVPLMAGTDLGGPFVFAGASLHDELELLVRAGLSPLEALQAATLSPATFLNRTDVGAIESGTLADIVLLNADPLEDISHTRRIAAVIANGQLFDRDALAQLARH